MRRYDSQDARRRVLAACARLFLEKGYTKTRMVDILREADVPVTPVNRIEELENDPQGIWGTNFFGKSLHDLVSEGMAGKASNMPKEAQTKMRKTLSKIVNEGKGGIICILL